LRKNEKKIESISQLEDFYIFFENNALSLKKNHDLVKVLLEYKNKTNVEHEKQQLQWEIDVFLFSFHGARIFSFSGSNGTTIGEVMEYPQLDQFQSDAFDFIKQRGENSNATLLRARYYHVLWKSILKNKIFSEKAIENYIATINQCIKLTSENDDYSYEICRLYENLVALTQEAKAIPSEAKKLTTSLLSNQHLSFWLKHGVIDEMLKYPKIFKADDFKNVLLIYERRIIQTDAKSDDDFLLANHHLPTAIKVAQKTKSDVRKWYNEIGNAYLRIAATEKEEERYWLKLDAYRCAIEAFRSGGSQESKEQTEQLYFELKPHVRLDEYRIDFDEETIQKLQAFQDELKAKALNLLKEEPSYIYSRIARGSFFPNYEDVLKAAKDKETGFLDFVTTIHFDNNKNISKQLGETHERREILEKYGNRMDETLLPFLHYVIVLGIKCGHLTSKNFLNFLVHHSWIGKPHVRINLSGNPEETNWIFQIAPSIIEFFNQVLAWGESKYYHPNFILCTDSLTLKIEGLFRNFSERLNISTSKGKKKGMQEALAHDIINNDTIRKYFDGNDILLFDYVFSNDGGLNMRNNIAHCFYSEHEYHPDKMLLLLAVLLRLGKYNLNAKSGHST
jgi:Domain of unknown function (DUF4209)